MRNEHDVTLVPDAFVKANGKAWRFDEAHRPCIRCPSKGSFSPTASGQSVGRSCPCMVFSTA